MLVEVGKTYINRAGHICKVVCRTDSSVTFGTDSYYSYFPLEDGKENREKSFQVDRYGSYLGELDSHDLVVEYKLPDFKWEWCAPDKIGLWAFGGSVKGAFPVLCTVSVVPHISYVMDSWRCYLGPLPQIAQPKKVVKQTLWMVKYYATGTWQELWLPDEEVPKFKSFHDIGHKTTTTREV